MDEQEKKQTLPDLVTEINAAILDCIERWFKSENFCEEELFHELYSLMSHREDIRNDVYS